MQTISVRSGANQKHQKTGGGAAPKAAVERPGAIPFTAAATNTASGPQRPIADSPVAPANTLTAPPARTTPQLHQNLRGLTQSPGGQARPTPTRQPGATGFGSGRTSSYAGFRGSPQTAQAGPAQFDSMREYQDQAFQHGMSRLQPQIDQQNRRAAQDLVNRGIDPASAAGRNMLDQNARNQNDLRSSMLTQAMRLGLQAQNQAFGQSANNADRRQRHDQFYSGLGEQGRQFDAGLRERGRQFDAGLNEGGRQFDVGMNQRQSEFDRNRLDANTDRGWNMLQQALMMDQNIWNMNQQAGQQQFNARQAIAGSIPGWNPAMIDVNGAANAATNSQNARFNAQQSMNPWNVIGQAGVGFASGGGGWW